MANTASIETQTQCRRITLNPPPANLDQSITSLCDTMGAAGYQLCGTFVLGSELILVFELTR